LWALRPWLLTTFARASAAQGAVLWVENVATLSAAFAVFNLIPIPPFTGGLILAGYAPRLHGLLMRRIMIPAAVFTAILFAADAAELVDPAFRAIAGWFFR
jgi:Zn-dependent protease